MFFYISVSSTKVHALEAWKYISLKLTHIQVINLFHQFFLLLLFFLKKVLFYKRVLTHAYVCGLFWNHIVYTCKHIYTQSIYMYICVPMFYTLLNVFVIYYGII